MAEGAQPSLRGPPGGGPVLRRSRLGKRTGPCRGGGGSVSSGVKGLESPLGDMKQDRLLDVGGGVLRRYEAGIGLDVAGKSMKETQKDATELGDGPRTVGL